MCCSREGCLGQTRQRIDREGNERITTNPLRSIAQVDEQTHHEHLDFIEDG